MSNPTTPFGWQMPTNTDLVTDLPADFEVFGQAVATSMADLLGGTTGQVLAKNTDTDMDFVWTSPNPGDITEVTAGTGISGGGTSGAVTITNSMATAIDAKGDLIVGTGADTFARLASSAVNNDVLMVDTSTATGLKFATPSSGGMTLINTGGTTLTGASVTISSIPATYNDLRVVIRNFRPATDASLLCMRINGDAGASVYRNGVGSVELNNVAFNTDLITLGGLGSDNGANSSLAICNIYDYANTSTFKMVLNQSILPNSGTPANNNLLLSHHYYNGTGAISSLEFRPDSGNFTSGTVFVYGVK